MENARWLAAQRVELEQLYFVATRAADPRHATALAVHELALESPPFVIAIGKAAAAMARGTLDALTDAGLEPAGGLVVSHDALADVGSLPHLQGAHPVPDERSRVASEALARLTLTARDADDVIVLVSGGTTSLIAQAIPDLPDADVPAVFEALLRSGLPIGPMNAVRRRILRWGAGRLAQALAPARVHCFIVSDVMGSELAAIGSGPCVPDTSTAAEVRAAIHAARIDALPTSVRDYLARVERCDAAETPKVGDPEFLEVKTRVILDNSHALAAVRDAADAAGIVVLDAPAIAIEGEAAELGRTLAHALARAAASLGTGERALWVAGGEATVTLPSHAQGTGGRCQELALACALEWHALGAASLSLLAAGTDGRDGPTDAAGAIVDASTIAASLRAGRDPHADLQAHDAFPALDAAGALLRTGPTGTNVNDVVLALLRGP
jgi:hydroxypyruvate reductase